jgi:hypothetical protein
VTTNYLCQLHHSETKKKKLRFCCKRGIQLYVELGDSTRRFKPLSAKFSEQTTHSELEIVMMTCFDGDENWDKDDSSLMDGNGSTRKKPWTKAEDKMLVELVQRHDSYGYW